MAAGQYLEVLHGYRVFFAFSLFLSLRQSAKISILASLDGLRLAFRMNWSSCFLGLWRTLFFVGVVPSFRSL